MQFTVLIAIVVGFTSLYQAQPGPVDAVPLKLVLAGLAASALVGMAWWVAQLQRHGAGACRIFRWVHRGEQLHGVAYLLVVIVLFTVLDVAQIAHSNWSLGEIFFGDDVAVLLVLSLPLFGSWVCLAEGGGAATWGERLTQAVRQARYTLVVPLVPVLALAAMGDLRRWTGAADNQQWEGIAGLLVMALFTAGLPWLLRYCWATRPLPDGPARRAISQLCQRAEIRIGEILEWDTSGQMINAAISGFFPPLRYLFVSDGLLRRLTADEVLAVAAHELGHCRHRHLPRLVLSLGVPFFGLLLAGELLAQHAWLGNAGIPLLVSAILTGWAFVHGSWARQFEHQADLAGCLLLSGSEALTGEAIELFSRALWATSPRPAGDWLHPAPADRVTLLRRFLAEPAVHARFERQMSRLNWLQWELNLGLALAWLVLA